MAQESQEIKEVRALAARLAVLEPESNEDISNLGFMAGALYALLHAGLIGFDEKRVIPNPKEMADEFQGTLEALGTDQPPPGTWVAGFFLNSAMMRLSALNERLDRSADLAGPVRQAVNRLKHDPDGHISGRGGMSFPDVLDAARKLAVLMEARIG